MQTKEYILHQKGSLIFNALLPKLIRICPVQFSRSVMFDSLWPHESKHTRPPCPSPIPGVYSNSCPSSQWCRPAISSSAVTFSSCSQSLPASGSFPMSQLFAWGGQSIRVSALASVLPINTQDWSPLEWTGWISLQSKGLSRVFSSTTVQKSHALPAIRDVKTRPVGSQWPCSSYQEHVWTLGQLLLQTLQESASPYPVWTN